MSKRDNTHSRDERAPAVSVVMPVHNTERFVGEAIESILGQTLQDIELILVDDGSTDRSPAILDEYAARDARICVVRHPTAMGRGAARNTGIDVARAELLAFADADDVSLPERLEQQKAYMDAHPDVGLVFSKLVITDVDGNTIGIKRTPFDKAQLLESMRRYCHFNHVAALFRTQVVRDAGGYRNGFAAAQDYDLLLRLIERAKTGVLDVPVYRYRQVPTGVKYGAGDVQRRSAAIAREFARQRAERGDDDYESYMRDGKMPTISKPAGPPDLPSYYCKLARTALDCGAYVPMLKYVWRGLRARPLWLPRFAHIALAGCARLVLQATGTLNWFERTFRGR